MFKKSLFIAFIALFLLRCSNKLEILAPYKESVAVYGLINQNDSVQYIRVQRVYLGEGNALSMAQNPDSCYYKPGDLKVTLLRIRNGNAVGVDNTSGGSPTGPTEIVLTETYITTQAGIFNSNQLLYKTNHKLYEDSHYRLVIHSNKTGKDFSSSDVGLLGDFKGGLIYAQQNSVLTVNPNPPYPTPVVAIVPTNGSVVCKFNSPVNASVCGLSLRFFYTDYPNSGPALSKYIDVPLGTQYLMGESGGELVNLDFAGNGMINSIANAIPVDVNINHRVADSVYFVLNGGGYDVSLYNQVNSSTSLSQTKPFYTNISGGVGVFSSRKDFSLLKKINNNSKDRLASDPATCPLHFFDSGSHISTSCP